MQRMISKRDGNSRHMEGQLMTQRRISPSGVTNDRIAPIG